MTEAGSTGGSTMFTKVSSKFSVGRLKKKKTSKPPSAYSQKSTKKPNNKPSRKSKSSASAAASDYKAPSSIEV